MTRNLHTTIDNCKLYLINDPEPTNPRIDFDNIGKMVCAHRRYDLGDSAKKLGWTFRSSDFGGWQAVEQHLRDECKAFVVLPLYLYDHSGITMNTTGFSCRWDSGQVGFIYVTRADMAENWPSITDEAELIQKAKDVLVSEVETYDQYLRGDVYGYIVEDENGRPLDTCYSYFGRESVIERGVDALKHYAAKRTKDKMSRATQTRFALDKVRESSLDDVAKEIVYSALAAYNAAA